MGSGEKDELIVEIKDIVGVNNKLFENLLVDSSVEETDIPIIGAIIGFSSKSTQSNDEKIVSSAQLKSSIKQAVNTMETAIEQYFEFFELDSFEITEFMRKIHGRQKPKDDGV